MVANNGYHAGMEHWIYLASASPRRYELLEQIGIEPRRIVIDCPEVVGQDESAQAFVSRLAISKAELGIAALGSSPHLVLGADTVVVVDGEILGKPRDREHAREMLVALSGREHQVLSAVALALPGQKTLCSLSCSTVSFRVISSLEIDAYWMTGEPVDKAGGYAIQGLGALFVTQLEGSYSGVMGLPLYETAELLGSVGLNPLLRPTRSTNE